MSSRCVRPPPPCSHLQAYRSGSFNDVERWKTFRTLHRCVQVRPLGGRAEIRRNLDEVLRCGSCGSVGPRLYACLACAAISCHRHAPAHTESNCPAPEIAVDIDRAELFCCVCVDQVYDVDFDVSIVLAQKKASPPISTSSSSTSAPSLASSDSLHKRRRVEYRPWSPDPEEEAVVRTRSSPMPFLEEMNSQQQLMSSEHTSLPLGLRGLNNLGSTCFMNSVLQALLHTPPLRNYFLSDRHNRYRCREQSKCSDSVGNAAIGTSSSQPTRNGVNAGTKNGTHSHFPMSKNMCLVCDLDVIYSDVFSGGRAPYSPAKLLYSWWQHASNLASYEQQDAHEFFISMLDAIHELAAKDQKKPHLQGNGDCCVAHRIFSGTLRSDVTCTICGFTSTTYDPCIDISLGLDSSKIPVKVPTVKSHTGNSGVESAPFCKPTLIGCLEHFTRPERLGSDQKLFCQHCEVRQESLKQMSIRKLPLVTSFHIKRFEHSSSRKISKKVDQFLQFPFSLDLAPYLSSAILRSRFGNRLFAFDVHSSDAPAKLASEFELFAVITHTGKLDSGHYVTFLRLSDKWYKCDDAWITHVSENVVRASQAYMLFYVQKMLLYKANDDVSNSL